MPNRMLPISVRISLDDAAFLSGHSIAGATTPSEKIRALIREARHRRAGVRDYKEGLIVQDEQLAEVLVGLRTVENELKMRSEVINILAHWLPETMAYFLAHCPNADGAEPDRTREALHHLEEGAVERLVALLENVLRLAVTPKNPCYDERIIGESIESVLQLSQLLLSQQQARGDHHQ